MSKISVFLVGVRAGFQGWASSTDGLELAV